MFSFRLLDEKSRPYLRGVRSVIKLIATQEQIFTIPGHIFLLNKDCTILKAFDAVSSEISKDQEVTLEIKNLDYRIVSFIIDKHEDLIILAVSKGRQVFSWQWHQKDFSWSPLNTWSLPSIGKKNGDIQAAAYSSKYSTFLWLEENGKLFSSKAKITPINKKLDKVIEIQGSPQLLQTLVGVKDFLATKEGVWLMSEQSLQFWSHKQQCLYTFHVDENSTSEENLRANGSQKTDQLKSVLQLVVHPVTEEAVVVDPFGSLFLCSLDILGEAKIQPKYLYSLRPFTLESSTKPQFFVSNQVFGYIQWSELICNLYDTKCGLLLERITLPGSVEAIYTGGLWGPDGVFELINTPVTKQAGIIAQHTHLDGVLPCAVRLCGDWNLPFWQSKYALDAIMSHSNETAKRNACDTLLEHVQSPAIILPLLSKIKSNRYINQKVLEFLAKFNSDTSKGSNAEASRFAALTSFHYYTPLNRVLVPALEKYLELSTRREEELPVQRSTSLNLLPGVDGLKIENVLKWSRAKMEFVARKEPKKLLQVFEDSMERRDKILIQNLVNGEPESLGISHLSAVGLRVGQHLLFEILCRLYYSEKPKRLIPFIDMMCDKTFNVNVEELQGGSSVAKKLYCHRALAVLPPPLLSHNPSIEVYAQIMCYADEKNKSIALGLLLGSNAWDSAVNFCKQQENNELELFELLLSHCMETGRYDRFDDTWKFLPRECGIMTLLQLLSNHSKHSTAKQNILATSNECMISVLQSQLSKMLDSETR